MLTPNILLSHYADPASACVENPAMAEALIGEIQARQHNFVQLDFTGVASVSREFTQHFLALIETHLPDIWLSPNHYEPDCLRLVKPLLKRLKHQRHHAWNSASVNCYT